ncbi:MAG TPA: hypothetical protein DGT23_19305 [Micromonosporaceae bacterium]|nr:hypothetical protein [Micromonosporaceae bacterium]
MGSGLPWTILRAAQFYDLVVKVGSALAKLPIVPVPAGRFQPIDAGEVAERMTALALAGPAGMVSEIAGPRIYEMPDLIRGYIQARGKRRPVVPVALPGKAGRAIRAGAATVPGPAYGRLTWEEFLQKNVHADGTAKG